jgi:hypothetical protein
MAHDSEPRSATRPILIIALIAAMAAGIWFLRGRGDTPAPTARREAKAEASAADEQPETPEERKERGRARRDPEAERAARRARDEMRERILDALKKRNPAPATEPAAARPASTADEPKGKYEPSYIQQAVRKDIFPLARECYEQALKRNPKLRGRLVLAFTLVGDPEVGGVVDEGSIDESSDLQDDEMSICVRESFMTLTLDKPPAGGGKVSVKYPLLFTPGDDDDEAPAGQADGGQQEAQGDDG